MPGQTRETVLNALLAHLEARLGTTFATYSRRFIDWERLVQLISDNSTLVPGFPALYLYDGGLKAEDWVVTGRGRPPHRTLTRHLVIYARLPGAGTPPGPPDILTTPAGLILNPLIEAVENAFTPGAGGAVNPDNTPEGVLRLGGLVWWARIEGAGDTIPGNLDPSGLMMQTIPVRIMIP